MKRLTLLFGLIMFFLFIYLIYILFAGDEKQ